MKINCTKTILGACLVALSFIGYAQGGGVSINPTGAQPDQSAMLDVNAPDKGMLIPRLSTTQRNSISSPAAGLMIYNTTSKCLEMYENGVWQPVYCAVSPAGAAGTISGSATVCTGQTGVSFSVAPISGATSYTWSYSGTGATIIGSGNSVVINFSGAATSGDLTVMGSNSLGNGSVSPNFPVTISSLPAAAGNITGTASVCQGAISVAYSVGSITDATSYIWSYSGTGATINGTGNAVTIDFSPSATAGNLTVAGSNSCGTGTASSTYAVLVNTAPASNFTFSPTNPTMCEGVTFTANATAISNAYQICWSGAPMIAPNTCSNSVSLQWCTVGTVDVSLTVTNNGCSTTTTIPVVSAAPAHGTYTYNYNGNYSIFGNPVTNGLSQITFECIGAQGNSCGSTAAGEGGSAKGTLALTGGEVFNIYVGAQNGYNGGFSGNGATAGGGASDVRFNGNTLNDRIIVGGGGGGTGYNANGCPSSSMGYGGNGGGSTGGTGGALSSWSGGLGGSQSAGGAGGTASGGGSNGGAGSFGQGGSSAWLCGGGGGGYYGGGGGANVHAIFGAGGGGGGGSNYLSPSLTSTVDTQGGNASGDGRVIITW